MFIFLSKRSFVRPILDGDLESRVADGGRAVEWSGRAGIGLWSEVEWWGGGWAVAGWSMMESSDWTVAVNDGVCVFFLKRSWLWRWRGLSVGVDKPSLSPPLPPTSSLCCCVCLIDTCLGR